MKFSGVSYNFYRKNVLLWKYCEMYQECTSDGMWNWKCASNDKWWMLNMHAECAYKYFEISKIEGW